MVPQPVWYNKLPPPRVFPGYMECWVKHICMKRFWSPLPLPIVILQYCLLPCNWQRVKQFFPRVKSFSPSSSALIHLDRNLSHCQQPTRFVPYPFSCDSHAFEIAGGFLQTLPPPHQWGQWALQSTEHKGTSFFGLVKELSPCFD